MARLPEPGQDGGTWGYILNEFLQVAHTDEGTLKPIAQSQVVGLTSSLSSKYVKPGSGVPEADLSTDVQTKLNAPAAEPADGSITSAKIADGTITNDDISGTAAIAKSKLASLNIADGDVTALSISKITNLQTSLDAKQNSLGFTPENTANKGQINGYASLDSGGKVPSGQLPPYADDALAAHLAGTETFTGLKTFPDIILTGSASPTYAQGKLAYDTTNQSLNFYNSNSGIGLQIGQEEWVRVINNTAAIITNGTPVYITGAASNLPAIAPAIATSLAASMVIGLTTESIAIGATGFVTISGLVRDINTSAFTAGATVYVSSAAAGALVSTAPAVPNFTARVGTVLISNTTTGVILVSPNPPRLFTQQAAATDLGVALSNLGYRVAGTAYPITTSGAAALSGATTLSGAAALTGNVRYGVLTTTTATLTLTAASVKYQFLNAASNGIAVTLPATTTAGIEFEFIRIDATANVVTINGTINGVSGYPLTAQYQGVKIVTTTVSGTFYAEPFGAQAATPVNRLASVSGISGTVTGVTNLYTVPTGRTAIITSAVIRCTAATTISAGPTLGIGVAAGEEDVYASTAMASLTTAGQLYGFSTNGMSVSAAAASIIKVGIDSAATGTSQTLTIDLVGYLV